MPVVAVLARDGPARFGTILERLRGASRDTLAETLRHLVAEGAVAHEGAVYRLTPPGIALGPLCEDALRVIPAAGIVAIALKKWPLLALVCIARGESRFNEIKARLAGITSGALAPALKDLEGAGLVMRTVDGGYPPVARYTVTAAAAPVVAVVEAIVVATERLAPASET